jgi:branched-chain amino acid transport system permease protein
VTASRALDGLVLVGLAVFPILMPGYLDLGTRMVILALCALSLDLVVGYCGLVTLGHAAFFGAGAYVAGIFAIRVWAEPVLGLLWAVRRPPCSECSRAPCCCGAGGSR